MEFHAWAPLFYTILLREKGLIISDTTVAKQTLEKLSYYSLIGGYKQLFKHFPSQKYIYGVTFDENHYFRIIFAISMEKGTLNI